MVTISLSITAVILFCIGVQQAKGCNFTRASQCMLEYWPPPDVGQPKFNADLILSLANGNQVAADVICKEAPVALEGDACLREALLGCDAADFEKAPAEFGWVMEKLPVMNQLAEISAQIMPTCQGNPGPDGTSASNSTPGCENFNQEIRSVQDCFTNVSNIFSGLRLDNVTTIERTEICTALSEANRCGVAIVNVTQCHELQAQYYNQIAPSFLQVEQFCIQGQIERIPGCEYFSQEIGKVHNCFKNVSNVFNGLRLDNVTTAEGDEVCTALSEANRCGVAIVNVTQCHELQAQYYNQIAPSFLQVEQFCIQRQIEGLPGCERFRQETSDVHVCFSNVSNVLNGIRLDNATATEHTEVCSALSDANRCGVAIVNATQCQEVQAQYYNQIAPSLLQVEQFCIQGQIEKTPGCENFNQKIRSVHDCFSNVSSILNGLRLDNVTDTERTEVCNALSEANRCGVAIANATQCQELQAQYYNQIAPSFLQVEQFCIQGQIENTPGCENIQQELRSVQDCFSNISNIFSGLRLDNVTTTLRTEVCTTLSDANRCGATIANSTQCQTLQAQYFNQIAPSFQQVEEFCTQDQIEARVGCGSYQQEIQSVYDCFNNVSVMFNQLSLDNVTVSLRNTLCTSLEVALECGHIIANDTTCQELKSQYYNHILATFVPVDQFCAQGNIPVPTGCENMNQEVQGVYECFSNVSSVLNGIDLENTTSDRIKDVCSTILEAQLCGNAIASASNCQELQDQYHNQVLPSLSRVDPYCRKDVVPQREAEDCVKLTNEFFQCLAPLAPYSGIDLTQNPDMIPEICRQYPIVQQCQDTLFPMVNQTCPPDVTQRYEGVFESQQSLNEDYCIPLKNSAPQPGENTTTDRSSDSVYLTTPGIFPSKSTTAPTSEPSVLARKPVTTNADTSAATSAEVSSSASTMVSISSAAVPSTSGYSTVEHSTLAYSMPEPLIPGSPSPVASVQTITPALFSSATELSTPKTLETPVVSGITAKDTTTSAETSLNTATILRDVSTFSVVESSTSTVIDKGRAKKPNKQIASAARKVCFGWTSPLILLCMGQIVLLW